jgi:hypothetical protein
MGKRLLFFIFTSALIFLSACNNNNTKQEIANPVKDSLPSTPPNTHESSDQGNKLIGTTVLRGSDRNLGARFDHGIWLDSLGSSECSKFGERPPPTKIMSVTQPYDSVLIVQAQIVADCSHSFLGEIEVLNGNTLNLVYTEYGGMAACMCCFGLTYKIRLEKDEEFSFKKIKYISLNGYGSHRLLLREP